jgi:hypothetical protein
MQVIFHLKTSPFPDRNRGSLFGALGKFKSFLRSMSDYLLQADRESSICSRRFRLYGRVDESLLKFAEG